MSEEDYITVNSFDVKDKEFKEPLPQVFTTNDIKKGLFKNDDGYFVKYYIYKFENGQMSKNKTEDIIRIEPKEYKRIKKLI
jgi:hypothetical protein